MGSQRDLKKREYQAYRRAAREGVLAEQDCVLTVSGSAEVQVTEGGAFVEARIWIPRKQMAEVLKRATGCGQ